MPGGDRPVEEVPHKPSSGVIDPDADIGRPQLALSDLGGVGYAFAAWPFIEDGRLKLGINRFQYKAALVEE